MTSGIRNTEQSFWSFVDRSSDISACWLWRGPQDHEGYGRYTLRPFSTKLAHRLAWQLVHGPLSPSLKVLHHCDSPPCCNPYGEHHLFVGTQRENIMDGVSKGQIDLLANLRRGVETAALRHRKLSVSDIVRAQELLSQGYFYREIAEYYEVTTTTLKTWLRRYEQGDRWISRHG